MAAVRVLLVSGSLLASVGTLLSLSRSPHWLFRLWDFPRVQIAILAVISNGLYALLFYEGWPAERFMLLASAAAALWQCYRIFPYTPIARTKVLPARPGQLTGDRGRKNRFSLLVSNVLMENREHQKLLALIEAIKPDVVLVVETDESWLDALKPLHESYPYRVDHPLDNYYGMAIFSTLELIDPRVKFLVQDDIPSIHTGIRLPGGEDIRFYALHPRPPEPIRDQPSTPRDAELVMVGREIGDRQSEPTVVAGDLNDVGWSPTSELFLRLSGLLDPRLGRGFFNTYNAKNPLFRHPLDHVFHSNEFKLIELRRLESIGSDHFPILISLLLDPEAPMEQPETEKKSGDEAEADEKLEKQANAAASGEDRPNDD